MTEEIAAKAAYPTETMATVVDVADDDEGSNDDEGHISLPRTDWAPSSTTLVASDSAESDGGSALPGLLAFAAEAAAAGASGFGWWLGRRRHTES